LILLDTHVLVWLSEANSRLGNKSRKAIETAYEADKLTVSAISFWEIGTLIRKDRIRLDMELNAWRGDFIEQGLIELPITGEVALKAAELDPFHGDPADRIIAATALKHSLTLLTADRRLLDSDLAITRINACC
jgi:PIN domain nuclease of toxin-antitoxin system